MSCTIGTFIGSECGTTSSKLNITQETISISLCDKDVGKHLHTTSVTDISAEYDLILTRAGVFEYDEEYISRTTVCPKHRYQLGGGWFQKRVCRYPDHTGKAKADRSINKLQSKIIFHELKNLVPVGSGKVKVVRTDVDNHCMFFNHIVRFCGNKKRHSNKRCQAPFGL